MNLQTTITQILTNQNDIINRIKVIEDKIKGNVSKCLICSSFDFVSVNSLEQTTTITNQPVTTQSSNTLKP